MMVHFRVAITCRHGRGYVPATTRVAAKGRAGKLGKAIAGLRAALSQTAWAAAAKKHSTFKIKYQRLKVRRGPQPAATAVSHAQLIALYWVLRNGVPYKEQAHQLEEQRRESLIRHHLHRLSELGYKTA